MHSVTQELLNWYRSSHRQLPWRDTVNPYRIWVSEIILQQTRVDQGLDYYLKFVDKFPTISDLAHSNETEVLTIWQGLGYYARARNMHQTAKFIVHELNGVFPNDYHSIRSLKGIGDYTAAAIASFAFKLPHVAIDGNVKRVAARWFGIDIPISKSDFMKQAHQALTERMPAEAPDIYNQALIELGAMKCTPVNPQCLSCPIAIECAAYKLNRTTQLPVVLPKSKPIKKYLHYFLIEFNHQWALIQRPSEKIWGGLFEFPNLEDVQVDNIPQNYLQELQLSGMDLELHDNPIVKHQLSHQTIHARCWLLKVKTVNASFQSHWEFVNPKEIAKFPLHKLMQKLILTVKL